MLKRLWRWMFGESRIETVLRKHDEAVDDLESTTRDLMRLNHGGFDTMDGEV